MNLKNNISESQPLLSRNLDNKLNIIICIFILIAMVATFILIIIKN
jgi:hypothetical protein